MSSEEEYIKCLRQLQDCVKHLKLINKQMENIGFKKIPKEDIAVIEDSVEGLQHFLENDIK